MSEQSPSRETPVPRVVFDSKEGNGGKSEILTENPSNPAIILNSASEEKDSLLFVEQPIDTVDALPSKKHYSNFDFLVGIISIVSYVFDLSMDIIVAVYFYHLGENLKKSINIFTRLNATFSFQESVMAFIITGTLV